MKTSCTVVSKRYPSGASISRIWYLPTGSGSLTNSPFSAVVPSCITCESLDKISKRAPANFFPLSSVLIILILPSIFLVLTTLVFNRLSPFTRVAKFKICSPIVYASTLTLNDSVKLIGPTTSLFALKRTTPSFSSASIKVGISNRNESNTIPSSKTSSITSVLLVPENIDTWSVYVSSFSSRLITFLSTLFLNEIAGRLLSGILNR